MTANAGALEAARSALYDYQARWAEGVPPFERDPRDVALERAQHREDTANWQGDDVFVGTFRFEAAKERSRLDRTREIIDRVMPGPYEDGGYFEMLCRQAATIELLIESIPQNEQAVRFMESILIGTIGEPRSHAATRLYEGPVPGIVLSGGMMYAYYQISKAVVLSWLHTESSTSGSRVVMSGAIEDTRKNLDADPLPVQIVVETITNWLFTGIARPDSSTAPPANFLAPLTLMINYAERFVLAHEYSHAFLDQLQVPLWGFDPVPVHGVDKEHRADVLATILVAESAAYMDSVAPNIALQGAVVGMKVHEMVDEALVMARGGRPLPASSTHPPFADRFALLVDQYNQTYGALGDKRLEVEGLLVARETADELWRRAAPQVADLLAPNPPLHPVWAPRLA